MTPADIKKVLETQGIYWELESDVGQRVRQFIKDGLPFASIKGLQLVKDKILDQPEIWSVLESTFERAVFSFFRGYGFDTERAYTMSRYDGEMPFEECLMIQLWDNDSTAVFHQGSHINPPPARPAANNLFEVAHDALQDPAQNVHVEFEHGGWALVDPRCAFTIKRGFVIIALFATENLVRSWGSTMRFPEIAAIKVMMSSMESEKVKLNITLGL